MKIKDFIDTNKSLANSLMNKNISENFYEFKKENMPNKRGIYFIYEKNTEELVYIGCAHSIDRTIKKRCSQYLGRSLTGAGFRDKIMEDILKTKPTKSNGTIEGEICKDIDAINEAINYIKSNYIAKFIVVDDNTSPSDVLLMERACINKENPIYNDTNSFTE